MKIPRHLLSVCIPTYEMRGLGATFLEQSLTILSRQTFTDFNVIISDYSVNSEIEKVCSHYKKKLDIRYLKNKRTKIPEIQKMSANTNNALKNATGILSKLLFLDDFLYDKYSLEKTVEAFDLEKDHWLVSACEHSKNGKSFIRPFYPRYNHLIHLGNNTISSPSVLTMKNDQILHFDENLTWLMDCDYYKRCYAKYGSPKVLNEITVVNRIGMHQITNTEATEALKKTEYDYINSKYKSGINTIERVVWFFKQRLPKYS